LYCIYFNYIFIYGKFYFVIYKTVSYLITKVKKKKKNFHGNTKKIKVYFVTIFIPMILKNTIKKKKNKDFLTETLTSKIWLICVTMKHTIV